MRRTYVLKLDVAQFTKFGHGIVSNLGTLRRAGRSSEPKNSQRREAEERGEKKESRNGVGYSSTVDVLIVEVNAVQSRCRSAQEWPELSHSAFAVSTEAPTYAGGSQPRCRSDPHGMGDTSRG